MRILIVFAAFYLFSTVSFAQSKPDQILGIWWNEERTSRVEVTKKGNRFIGKVVYLKDNSNVDGTTPRLDLENPEEKLRDRPIMGIQILNDLVWDEDDNEWDDGEIYDPKTGNTYSCYAKLNDDGTLYMKGYVLGMPFLGRSTEWTRFK